MRNGGYAVPADIIEALGIDLVQLDVDWRCHSVLECLEMYYLTRGRDWIYDNLDAIREQIADAHGFDGLAFVAELRALIDRKE
jgi:hypothetical protein